MGAGKAGAKKDKPAVQVEKPQVSHARSSPVFLPVSGCSLPALLPAWRIRAAHASTPARNSSISASHRAHSQATRTTGVLTRRAAAAQAAREASAVRLAIQLLLPASQCSSAHPAELWPAVQGPEAAQPANAAAAAAAAVVPAARQRTAHAKASDVAPPAAKRPTSMSALLAQRSAEVDARPSTAAEEPAAAEDIDVGDRLDNRAASEYVSYIFSYFQRVEPLFRVSPSYMAKQARPHRVLPLLLLLLSSTVLTCAGRPVQTDINEKMRAILVDWLVEVHFKFKVCARGWR